MNWSKEESKQLPVIRPFCKEFESSESCPNRSDSWWEPLNFNQWTPILRFRHWLRIEKKIDYKRAVHAYKWNGPWLVDLSHQHQILNKHTHKQTNKTKSPLRSVSSIHVRPMSKLKFLDCAFSNSFPCLREFSFAKTRNSICVDSSNQTLNLNCLDDPLYDDGRCYLLLLHCFHVVKRYRAST